MQNYFSKLKSLVADAKIIPLKPKRDDSPFIQKLIKKLEDQQSKEASHVEKMREAARLLNIPYKESSIFKMLDGIDAHLAKFAGQDPEISRILFEIKKLKADQRRDLSSDKPAKKIEALREQAIQKILKESV